MSTFQYWGQLLALATGLLSIIGYLHRIVKFALVSKNEVQNVKSALDRLSKQQKEDHRWIKEEVKELRNDILEILDRHGSDIHQTVVDRLGNTSGLEVMNEKLHSLDRRVDILEKGSKNGGSR